MNTEEKRFHAAVSAMQGLLTHADWISAGWVATADASIDMADALLEQLDKRKPKPKADALLAELDRTAVAKESLTPQPDADGWIAHKPGDPVPCELDLRIDVKIDSEIIRYSQTAGYWRGDSDLESSWNDCGEFSIIAWRPANTSA
jgi:hypothetical protein